MSNAGVDDELRFVEVSDPRRIGVIVLDLLERRCASPMASWVAVRLPSEAWANASRSDSIDRTRGVVPAAARASSCAAATNANASPGLSS